MPRKSKHKVKDVTGHPAPSSYEQDRAKEYQERYGSIDTIDFNQSWMEARTWDPTLPHNPPKNLPEEAQQAVIVLARRVLQLESEWS